MGESAVVHTADLATEGLPSSEKITTGPAHFNVIFIIFY